MDYNELLDIANNEPQGNDDSMYERPQPPQEQFVFKNEERPPYNPQDEMKRIQERQQSGDLGIDLSRTKLPMSIINEFIEHPIDYSVEDPNMKDFTDHLGGKMNSAADLMRRVDNMTVRKGVVERKQPAPTTVTEDMFSNVSSSVTRQAAPAQMMSGGIDYKLIKTIIEQVVDERLGKITNAILTESAKVGGNNTAKISAIKLGEKFMLLDENNNVYSCEPKFVGKNKAKAKK